MLKFGDAFSPTLNTDELKMAFRARKVSRAFEKRVPVGIEPRDLPIFLLRLRQSTVTISCRYSRASSKRPPKRSNLAGRLR